MSSLAYDPSTSLGQVRLLIADTDATQYLFTDAEIESFLSMESSNTYMAAARAYATIVRSRGLLAKRIKREGYETEDHAIADLRAMAKDLEEQAQTAGGLQSTDFAVNDDHFEVTRPGWRDIDSVTYE